jgi:hypothetical protein
MAQQAIMKATQLLRRKLLQGDVLVEMVIWKLPKYSRSHPHGIKYRLFCGRSGECIVRYDNETGKGDHRHYGEAEEPYTFSGLDTLIDDFMQDCTRLAGWRWNDEEN